MNFVNIVSFKIKYYSSSERNNRKYNDRIKETFVSYGEAINNAYLRSGYETDFPINSR